MSNELHLSNEQIKLLYRLVLEIYEDLSDKSHLTISESVYKHSIEDILLLKTVKTEV